MGQSDNEQVLFMSDGGTIVLGFGRKWRMVGTGTGKRSSGGQKRRRSNDQKENDEEKNHKKEEYLEKCGRRLRRICETQKIVSQDRKKAGIRSE